MKRWATFVMVCWVTSMVGCVARVINTDPYQNPVVLTWSSDPTDQPNPGQLDAGFQADFTFNASTVNVNGYDPVFPEITDDTTVSLQFGQVHVIEWDGFVFIDRGFETITLSTILEIVTGNSSKVKAPSTEGLKANPDKLAAAAK